MKDRDLTEGLISTSIDYIMAYRLIKILWQPFTKTRAYELGIIDENGYLMKKPESSAERDAYTPFIRMCFKIKRVLNKVPGGNSKLGSIITAYALLKENVEQDELPSLKDMEVLFNELDLEELPPKKENMTTGVEIADAPIGEEPKKRNNWKSIEQFAGAKVFDVESSTYHKIKSERKRYERWSKFLNADDGEVGQQIIQYAKTYPDKPILIREKNTKSMMYIQKR